MCDLGIPGGIMMLRRTVSSLMCVATLGTQAFLSAQQTSVTPGGTAQKFEVVSVKANRSGDLAINLNLPAPDRFTATNIPLRDLIRFAYDVQDARLQGGPDWIRSERFDVVAKADHSLGSWGPAGPPAEMLVMLRSLLTERFALEVHRETRVLPVYALVKARENGQVGPELRRSSLDCEAASKTAQPRQPPATPANVAQPTCGMRIAPGQMVIGGTPLSQFATVLAPFVQRIVIDRTELVGLFDLHLSWTPQRLPQGGPPPPGAPALPPVDPNGASIFAALQEQLGLKLESQQAPLEVVVIDRADRPTPD
jgi:uncharacterized protein (TIGR03435 family)